MCFFKIILIIRIFNTIETIIKFQTKLTQYKWTFPLH